MEKIAALMLAVGSSCNLMDPKGIWSNGVWITSVFTATVAIVAAGDHWVAPKKAILIGAAVLTLCVIGGLLGLLREVRSWPED